MSILKQLKETIMKDFDIKDNVEIAKSVAKTTMMIEEAEREQAELLEKHSKLKEDYVAEVKRNMVKVEHITPNDKPKTDVDVYAEWKKGLST